MVDFFLLAAGVFVAVVVVRALTSRWTRIDDAERPDTEI